MEKKDEFLNDVEELIKITYVDDDFLGVSSTEAPV